MSFYDSPAWKALRLAHLSGSPWCVSCARLGYSVPAQHVDHVETIRSNPARRLDPSNLQSFCPSCHSVKTATEDKGKGPRGSDLDGMPVDPSHHWNT